MTSKAKPDKPNHDAYSQRLVLAVLRAAKASGEKLSSREIGKRTEAVKIPLNGRLQGFGISDPRKAISNLRKRGYHIADCKELNECRVWYKRYWLVEDD